MNFKSYSVAILSAAMVFGFSQCSQNNTPSPAPQEQQAPVAVSGLKIAVIDVDSLLSGYTFYQDLAEEMLRKEENYRLILAEDANKFQKEVEDFQKKLQNGVFSSQERAQQEQNRLAKKEQTIRDKSDKYSNELQLESMANSQKVSDAIESFIKEYNKTHGYNLIVSKSATMYSDDNMDITTEILNGLNSAYQQSNK